MLNNDIIDYLHYTFIFDEQEGAAGDNSTDENADENAARE